MKLKMLALLGALAFAAPVVAEAAPASGLTANAYSSMMTAPAAETNAAVAPGDSAKIEKVWWRGRGWGWRGRGFGWRGGYGWRRPFIGYGYGWRRPFWRRRWYY